MCAARVIGGKFRLTTTVHAATRTTTVHAATRTTTVHAATRTTICRHDQFTAWALELYLCVIVKGYNRTEVFNIFFWKFNIGKVVLFYNKCTVKAVFFDGDDTYLKQNPQAYKMFLKIQTLNKTSIKKVHIVFL